MANATKTKTKTIRPEAGKMHLYVDGKHKLSVNDDVAHEVAATYAREGSSVWLTRAPVTMTESKRRGTR